MTSLFEMSDRLWRGETHTSDPAHHPFVTLDQIDDVVEGVAFYKNFSNLAAIRSDVGLVLLDTGSFHPVAHARSHARVREWTDAPLHTAVYTHGHVDHAYGLPPFLEELKQSKAAYPSIVGHRDVVPRMKRYIVSAGFNSVINERQFGQAVEWPTEPIYPTATYDDRLDLSVGGRQFLIRHARGETDDHSWIFMPTERVLYTGDLFVWSVPNAGNPQKVQRYCADWIEALREMAALRPEYLLPGHGLPIAGQDRVRSALLETAEYLESLYQQTLEMMNEGATIDDLIHGVEPPSHLVERPFLQPVYDEPEFVVRNLYRCFGGWYSGIPSELKPAPFAAQGAEIASLAGGVDRLLTRAEEVLQAGDLRLASHLVDWAAAAEPASGAVHAMRAKVYQERTSAEPSTMSKGVFGAAARESEAKAEGG